MESWNDLFETEKSKGYWSGIWNTIQDQQSRGFKIFPPEDKIFRAFQLCPFPDLKIVILGQDPYHEEGQADGLAFSVPNGIKVPPSLRNIYQELGKIPNKNGDLTSWAEQGVLLLNSSLTVRESSPNSHENIGWKHFTDATISYISKNKSCVTFVLWGGNAFKKKDIIDTKKHVVIQSSHPSPLSAHKSCQGRCSFIGSGVFDILRSKNIDWFRDVNYDAI